MKIISGGQTGVDRTALEVARSVGVETGGYAPRGWRTDAGPDPSLAEFGLIECESQNYAFRTWLNVEHSDATVWFGDTKSPGFVCTSRAAIEYRKPLWINPNPRWLIYLLWESKVRTLNVAGNRLRTNPAAAIRARDTLQVVLTAAVLPI